MVKSKHLGKKIRALDSYESQQRSRRSFSFLLDKKDERWRGQDSRFNECLYG